MAPDRDESSLTPLSKILSSPDGLPDVIARARTLSRLDTQLKATLPPLLAAQFVVANVRDSTLVVAASSSTFAARLRLMTQQFLEAARSCGVEVSEVRLRVGYVPPPRPSPPEPIPLSDAARQQLTEAAHKMTDPELRELLEAFVAAHPPPGDCEPSM